MPCQQQWKGRSMKPRPFSCSLLPRSEFVPNREPSVECPLEARWRIEGRIGTGLAASIDVLVDSSIELRVGDVKAIEGELNGPLVSQGYWVVAMHIELQCGG